MMKKILPFVIAFLVAMPVRAELVIEITERR